MQYRETYAHFTYYAKEAFKPVPSVGAFVAKHEMTFPSPTCLIADVALQRVVDADALTLPEGYDEDVLRDVYFLSGYFGKEVLFSGRQAYEIRQIGEQLLSLNDDGKIQPPLDNREKASIGYLIDQVDLSEARNQTT